MKSSRHLLRVLQAIALTAVLAACARPADGASALETQWPTDTASASVSTTIASLEMRPGECVLQLPPATYNPVDPSAPVGTSPPTRFDHLTFWELHGPPSIYGNEVRTPESLAQLAEWSDVAVRGRITDIAPGTSVARDPSAPDSRGYLSTLVTVSDAKGNRYAFSLPRGASPDCVLTEDAIPKDEFVFMLKQGGLENDPGPATSHYCAVISACVLAPMPGGTGVRMMIESGSSTGPVNWPDTESINGLDALWSAASALVNH